MGSKNKKVKSNKKNLKFIFNKNEENFAEVKKVSKVKKRNSYYLG